MKEKDNSIHFQERHFLDTFPLIHQIASQKLRGFYRESIEDIVQKVGLNLWKWKAQRQNKPEMEKDLTSEEWLKVANAATQNEIRSFYQNKHRNDVSISDTSINQPELFHDLSSDITGNSNAEIQSLLIQLWKAIQTLSLRQKYAFLLQKEEFIVDLIHHGCCTKKELADSLNFQLNEFEAIICDFPFSDEDIRGMIEKQTGISTTVKQVWKARGKAKANLYNNLKDLI